MALGVGPLNSHDENYFDQLRDLDSLIHLLTFFFFNCNDRKMPRNRVSLWRFDTKYHFWSRISRRMARSLDSIVLEESAWE